MKDEKTKGTAAQGHKQLDFVALRAAELAPWLPFLHGNRFARVVAVKGKPGVAEKAGQSPFFGSDGEALDSALVALGWGINSWCGIVLELPEKGTLSASDVRLIIEIVDPRALLALDISSITALQESFGEKLLPCIPEPGVKAHLLGRTLVYVDGFETALDSQDQDDGKAKRRVWKELKALKI